MIARDVIVQFFRDTEAKGATLKRDMLWGYFFRDHDEDRLSKIRAALEPLGYRFVAVLEPTPEDDDQDVLHLHLERIERHTPDSLFRRCQELSELAAKHDLQSFDGFALGNVDGSPLYRAPRSTKSQ